MTLEHLVANYGSFGLFVGASLEGEGIAMLGGTMSHQHLIGVWPAIIALALGSFVADQCSSCLGMAGAIALSFVRFRGAQRVGV
ncbi:hypothetical protein [Vreelandella lionensis]|uniref:hypothetical protein n=1 Tax=Vreelandella lionensis TaxID=1144478 RepID=UPI0009F572B4|nr:hypothetical protein [Halomonas lionensis]